MHLNDLGCCSKFCDLEASIKHRELQLVKLKCGLSHLDFGKKEEHEAKHKVVEKFSCDEEVLKMFC